MFVSQYRSSPWEGGGGGGGGGGEEGHISLCHKKRQNTFGNNQIRLIASVILNL